MKTKGCVCALSAVLLTAFVVPACSGEGKEPASVAEHGTLQLPLEAVSDSGKVYRLRQATFPVLPFSVPGPGIVLRSEDDPSRNVLEALLSPGTYLVTLSEGWFMEQVDELRGTATPVLATLVSGSDQVFDIQEDSETFVRYAFEVDGERVQFERPGRLIVGVGVTERDGGVAPPPGGLDPRRSLLETSQQVAQTFSLAEVLAVAQQNSGLVVDPNVVYQQLIDSYASVAAGRLPGAAHCDDETTSGSPSLNGYPLQCDRLESLQIDNLGQWFATAIVNRMDLAPEDGAHCGQQRLVFANNAPIGNGRMFMILEAQIPNPSPGCGVDACRPIAEFWASLSAESSASARAARLREAFLTGEGSLSAAGIGPFMSIENLSVGSGNIRTNNFNDFQWTLRQFKLLSDPLGQTRVVPFPVGNSPHGPLWDDTAPLSAGALCRQSLVGAVGGLLTDEPEAMAVVVDSACLDAESPNDFSTGNYPLHLAQGSGAFRAELASALAGAGLTPENIAERARFAGSCMGCHEESGGADLGRGVTAPFSAGFVHVDEFGGSDCGDGTQCFRPSQALTEVFLPRRQRVLTQFLERPLCGGGVDGGSPGDAGSIDSGGPPPPPPGDAGAPAPSDAGTAPPSDGGAAPPPATVLTPDESIDDLVQEEAAARDALQGETLGGQPASVTH